MEITKMFWAQPKNLYIDGEFIGQAVGTAEKNGVEYYISGNGGCIRCNKVTTD